MGVVFGPLRQMAATRAWSAYLGLKHEIDALTGWEGGYSDKLKRLNALKLEAAQYPEYGA